MVFGGRRGRKAGRAIGAVGAVGARPLGHSELRIRLDGVEIAVTGTSREECSRKLLAEAARVDEGRVGE